MEETELNLFELVTRLWTPLNENEPLKAIVWYVMYRSTLHLYSIPKHMERAATTGNQYVTLKPRNEVFNRATIKSEVHTDINLVLIQVNNLEEQISLRKLRLKITNVWIVLVAINQTQIGYSVIEVFCELPSRLLCTINKKHTLLFFNEKMSDENMHPI